jgi:hypothetical protein
MTILYLVLTILMAYYTVKSASNKQYGWAVLSFLLFSIDAYTLAGLLTHV